MLRIHSARLAATASEEPLAQQLVNTLEVQTDDSEVAVSAVVPKALLEQAKKSSQAKPVVK